MKTSLKLSVLLASAAIFTSSALSAATTGVVGYVSTDLPAGVSVFAPALVDSDLAAGSLEGVTTGVSSTMTVSGLASGAYNEGASFPTHYMEIKNDTADDGLDTEGLILDIVSNTETGVLVAVDTSTLGIQGDEQYAIKKHFTLGDLAAGTAGLSAFDGVTIYNGSGVGSIDGYFYEGNGVWKDFSNNVGTDAPIYPGTGVVISLQTPATITIDGNVKESPTQIPLYAGQTNIVGAMKPISLVDIENGDTAFFDALGNFDGATVYAFGDLVNAINAVFIQNGQLVDFSLQPADLTIDGTSQGFLITTQNNTVYKASGTVIGN